MHLDARDAVQHRVDEEGEQRGGQRVALAHALLQRDALSQLVAHAYLQGGGGIEGADEREAATTYAGLVGDVQERAVGDGVEGLAEVDKGSIRDLARLLAALDRLHEGADLPHALLAGQEAGLLQADGIGVLEGNVQARRHHAAHRLERDAHQRDATVVVGDALVTARLEDGHHHGVACLHGQLLAREQLVDQAQQGPAARRGRSGRHLTVHRQVALLVHQQCAQRLRRDAVRARSLAGRHGPDGLHHLRPRDALVDARQLLAHGEWLSCLPLRL